MCVTFVVFTDCESCTRPISTDPVSMEAGEYGLTHGTCFVASRLEVVAVAGLLWISWCVLGAAGFISCLFLFRFFFFECTRPAASMRLPCLIYLSTSDKARPRTRSDRSRFAYRKKAASCRGAYRVPLFFFCLSVCVCLTFVVFTDCKSCTRPISATRDQWQRENMG